MRNTGRYRRAVYRRRRKGDFRRRRRNTGSSAGVRSPGRRIFNGILWTTSMIMILTLLPAESDAAKKLADLTEGESVLAMAAGKISDFGNDSLSGNRQEEENDDQEGNGAGEDGNSDAAKDAGSVGGIVLTDYTAADGENSPEIRLSENAISGVSAAADKASGIAEAAVQQSGGENLKQGEGNIIIYHTHATESYLPEASSNAHTTELKSTVREAGETLAARLELHGFSVVHDMTLHDYPSYNKSYNRSLETVKKLCASYSNKKLVIDLHRDAATSSGEGKTATIDGRTVAAFCIVVGTQNDNYDKLRAFAETITNKANEMYPGFAKPIVEKPYKFNEYVSDTYILLEMGNNANTIDEVNAAMPYLAKVLAEVIA